MPKSVAMTAIVVEGGKGPPEALRPAAIPRPEPRPGEVLIRVRAAGVNRADSSQRLGSYDPPPGAPDTIGLEVAGEVVEAAGRWAPGDRVCALLGGGGYAQYVACDARHALPIPPGLDFVQAAALPEAIFTVWANVFEQGALKAGERLLVHGATSGVGATAIQMAKTAGARVIATSRGAEKAAAARNLGADVAVDSLAEDFVEACRREGGADVVLDMVGGDYLKKDVEALRHAGRIVLIASVGGRQPAFPVYRLMQKQAVITGSMLRGRPADEKARLAAQVEHAVWPWVAEGKVRPPVDRSFPLQEAAQAHLLLESGAYVGKLVLTVD
jgi:putative PIG3 family NAD(P)H quinone oxidoreductase